MSYPSRESAQARHGELQSALIEVRHQAEELYGQVNVAITRAEAAEARVAELEAHEKSALDLLRDVVSAEMCPRCGGCGYHVEMAGYDRTGSPIPEQRECDWCCSARATLAAEEGNIPERHKEELEPGEDRF